MKSSRPFLLTQHRLKRLAAWAMLMLAWMLAVFSDGAAISGRHARARHRRANLDRIARIVCALIAQYAAQLPNRRRKPYQALRQFAPRGFAQRPQRHLWRSAFGSALRRRLYAHDPRQRIAKLSAALRNLDELAAMFARRMDRGFTRLKPIVLVRPMGETVRTRALAAVSRFDSS
jgi:hypothetical protein